MSDWSLKSPSILLKQDSEKKINGLRNVFICPKLQEGIRMAGLLLMPNETNLNPSSDPILTTGRIQALSDGVYAIALTILVLTFEVPPTDEAIHTYLLSLQHKFLGYALSFILIATSWMINHKQFHVIKKSDAMLIWINIVSLMFVALLPFSTDLIGEHPSSQIAVIFFCGNLFFVGTLHYIHWSYATKNHRLVDPGLDPKIIRNGKYKNLLIPVASVIAIPLSFIAPKWSTIHYFLIPIIMMHLLKHAPAQITKSRKRMKAAKQLKGMKKRS